MQAVLYICHGSRVKEAAKEAKLFIEQCMKVVDAPLQEICFLELEVPSIAEGFVRCIEKGATKIAVVPVLLLAAGHAKQDIPNELYKLQHKYKDVAVSYGRPLGVHEYIPSILLERIGMERIEPCARVLIVGRGSSDPHVLRDMQRITSLVENAYPFEKVDFCFLAAAKPSFQEGLQQILSSHPNQLFVVPYLLFTGRLMQELECTITQLHRKNVVLCPFLGYHPKLVEVLKQRTEEAIRGEVLVSHYNMYEG